MKCRIVFFVFFIISVLGMFAQTYTPRKYYGARLEPKEGVIHGAGQSAVAFCEYVHALGAQKRPQIYMAYTGLNSSNMRGSINSILKILDEYDWKLIPQIGLSMTKDGSPELHYEHEVAKGVYDKQIDELCEVLKQWGKPVFVRIGYEFNGAWNGYQPLTYKKAFRRIVERFRKYELDNVAVVWCFGLDPGRNNDYMSFYPGDEYVDWFGIDLFTEHDLSSPLTVKFLEDADKHRKPVMIGESTPRNVGVEDGAMSWEKWYKPYFGLIASSPQIKAFCYINWNWAKYPQWANWGNARIQDNKTVLGNYRREMESDLYLHATDRAIDSLFVHPRVVITQDELQCARKRVSVEPYATLYRNMLSMQNQIEVPVNSDVYKTTEALRYFAYMYALSGDGVYAEKAWNYAEYFLTDSLYFCNVTSRGLNRAQILKDMSFAYDLCFDAWPDESRKRMSEGLRYTTMTILSNMGFDANYSLESNWMGIRYAVALLASLVNDDYETLDPRSKFMKPFEWDATNRLFDHIDTNFTVNGWNTESISYFGYNWSFIAPALIAFANRNNDSFDIKSVNEKLENSMWGFATASLAIQGREDGILQPDFSDDDPMGDDMLIYYANKLYGKELKPYFSWLIDYYAKVKDTGKRFDQMFYRIVFNDEDFKRNPEELGWLNYYDPGQGIALFRNAFKDSTDILVAYSATTRRGRGHQGPDNQSVRLLGLNNLWIVGGGRTGEVAGQSTLFPKVDLSTHKSTKKAVSEILRYESDHKGGGMIVSKGSCMGVDNHVRRLQVSYDLKYGTAATICLADSSSNGAVWRINVPSYMDVKECKDGFELIAPDGASLKAHVFVKSGFDGFTVSEVRYGGNTVRLNSGIIVHGKSYPTTKAIDVCVDKNVVVVFTMQPKGKKHPLVERRSEGQFVVNGELF